MRIIDDITNFIFLDDPLQKVDIILSDEGIEKVMGELMKCAGQFKEHFKSFKVSSNLIT